MLARPDFTVGLEAFYHRHSLGPVLPEGPEWLLLIREVLADSGCDAASMNAYSTNACSSSLMGLGKKQKPCGIPPPTKSSTSSLPASRSFRAKARALSTMGSGVPTTRIVGGSHAGYLSETADGGIEVAYRLCPEGHAPRYCMLSRNGGPCTRPATVRRGKVYLCEEHAVYRPR